MHEPPAAAAEMASPHATSRAALAPNAGRIELQMARRIIARARDGRATFWGDLIADGFSPQQIVAHFPAAKARVESAEALLRAPARTDAELVAIAVDCATGLLPSEQEVFAACRAAGLEARDIGRLWPEIGTGIARHVGTGKLPQVA